MVSSSIRVECRGPLPPAESVAGAVWGHAGIVLSPPSENWERLVVGSSKDESARVEVEPVLHDPLVLEVKSPDHQSAHTAALFIAMETYGRFM